MVKKSKDIVDWLDEVKDDVNYMFANFGPLDDDPVEIKTLVKNDRNRRVKAKDTRELLKIIKVKIKEKVIEKEKKIFRKKFKEKCKEEFTEEVKEKLTKKANNIYKDCETKIAEVLEMHKIFSMGYSALMEKDDKLKSPIRKIQKIRKIINDLVCDGWFPIQGKKTYNDKIEPKIIDLIAYSYKSAKHACYKKLKESFYTGGRPVETAFNLFVVFLIDIVVQTTDQPHYGLVKGFISEQGIKGTFELEMLKKTYLRNKDKKHELAQSFHEQVNAFKLLIELPEYPFNIKSTPEYIKHHKKEIRNIRATHKHTLEALQNELDDK